MDKEKEEKWHSDLKLWWRPFGFYSMGIPSLTSAFYIGFVYGSWSWVYIVIGVIATSLAIANSCYAKPMNIALAIVWPVTASMIFLGYVNSSSFSTVDFVHDEALKFGLIAITPIFIIGILLAIFAFAFIIYDSTYTALTRPINKHRKKTVARNFISHTRYTKSFKSNYDLQPPNKVHEYDMTKPRLAIGNVIFFRY